MENYAKETMNAVCDESCSYQRNKIDAIVAKEIWSIAAKSPEYGNALMDVLGEEIYNKVMILQREA